MSHPPNLSPESIDATARHLVAIVEAIHDTQPDAMAMQVVLGCAAEVAGSLGQALAVGLSWAEAVEVVEARGRAKGQA